MFLLVFPETNYNPCRAGSGSSFFTLPSQPAGCRIECLHLSWVHRSLARGKSGGVVGEQQHRRAQRDPLGDRVHEAQHLERIGDLDKNIAKRVVALDGEFRPNTVIRGVEHMASMVLGLLKQVLDAYGSHDLAAALAVWNGDEEVDALCTSLFRELLTYMMEDPRNITFCMHLMFCAKDIERMGDHATNIAETVYFMIEGRTITDQRPKGDTTSFPAGVLKK